MNETVCFTLLHQGMTVFSTSTPPELKNFKKLYENADYFLTILSIFDLVLNSSFQVFQTCTAEISYVQIEKDCGINH